MDHAPNAPQAKRKLFPSTLHLISSIYGFLYLIFIILSFLPSTIGLVSESDNPYDLENLVVKLLFVVFLAGFFVSWKREGIAGIIFVIWWVAMLAFGRFIVTPIHGHGTEGIVMGFPLLIFGILFIISWHNKKRVRTDSASSVGTDSQELPKS